MPSATRPRLRTLSLVWWRTSGSKPPSSRQARIVISRQAVPVWPVVQTSPSSSRSGTATGWRRAAGWSAARTTRTGSRCSSWRSTPAGRGWARCCHSSASTRSISPSASAGSETSGSASISSHRRPGASRASACIAGSATRRAAADRGGGARRRPAPGGGQRPRAGVARGHRGRLDRRRGGPLLRRPVARRPDDRLDPLHRRAADDGAARGARLRPDASPRSSSRGRRSSSARWSCSPAARARRQPGNLAWMWSSWLGQVITMPEGPWMLRLGPTRTRLAPCATSRSTTAWVSARS